MEERTGEPGEYHCVVCTGRWSQLERDAEGNGSGGPGIMRSLEVRYPKDVRSKRRLPSPRSALLFPSTGVTLVSVYSRAVSHHECGHTALATRGIVVGASIARPCCNDSLGSKFVWS